MAHTVRSKGPPPRPIYPTACVYMVGRLRPLHADCRPVGTTSPNMGPTFWTLKALQWAAHMAPRTHAVPWSGVDTGGLDWGHKAAHGARRTLHGSEWCGLRHSPPPTTPQFCVFIHSHNPLITHLFPSSSFSCQFGPTVSDLDIRTPVLVLPHVTAAAARRPGDRSPWSLLPAHAFSQSCILVFWPRFSFLDCPRGVNHSFSPSRPSSLSRASERATSITGHLHCCIYVIEPVGHQVPCSHLLGGVFIRNCVLHHRFVSLPCCIQTSPGSLGQRTMVGGLIISS